MCDLDISQIPICVLCLLNSYVVTVIFSGQSYPSVGLMIENNGFSGLNFTLSQYL